MIQRQHTDLTGLVSGAMFSDDMIYRYRLWRRWDPHRPIVNFLMLNPSTADDVQNDPTVERCERRARAAGAGELIVTNLFAYRATNPAELFTVADPVGPENEVAILAAAKLSDVVVCAWGAHGNLRKRRPAAGRGQADAIQGLLRFHGVKLWCLGTTGTGQPLHPLYIPYARKLEPLT